MDLHEAVAAAYDQEAASSAPETSPAAASSAPAPTSAPEAKSEVPAAPAPAAAPIDTSATPEANKPAEKLGDKPTGEIPPAAAPISASPETSPDARSRVDRAPASWRGEAKSVWAALPLHVRQEVTRRERDMERSMQEHAQARQTLDAVNQTIAPYADIIQRAYGGSPAKAVQQLFEVERILTTAPTAQKAQFVANLIKHYGVDIQALDGFLAGQASPEHQQSISFQQMLDQRLAPLVQFVQQQQTQQHQQQLELDNQMEVTVEQMATDSERFPYFLDVRQDMADLIDTSARRGVFLTLEQAYEKAVRMNDLTFDATAAQRAQSLAAQAQQQADAAKAASSSVAGTPVPQPVVPPNPADLHALLSSVYDQQMGNRI